MGKIQMIPSIVLSGEVLGLERGSEAWKAVTREVREACETYGCFLVEGYEKIPIELTEESLNAGKGMFDLPQEKKQQYSSPTPLRGRYTARDKVTGLYEDFSLYTDDEVQAFEKLMWPHGKPGFRDIHSTMAAKIHELGLLVLRMIFQSYGVEEYYNSKALDVDDNFLCNFRYNKYKVIEESEEGTAYKTHVDKSVLTVLFQNSEQGLGVLNREGNRIPVNIPRGGLVVLVGDVLEAWSNGRILAAKHGVVIKTCNIERYSCAVFTRTKDGITIEVPQELVDKKHPLLYRPFVYSEYIANTVQNITFDALRDYAGI